MTLLKRHKSLTLIDAKKDIFSLIQKGHNYQDITHQYYLIDGVRMKKFSIVEISRIKKEFDADSNKHDYDHVEPDRLAHILLKLISNKPLKEHCNFGPSFYNQIREYLRYY